MKEKFVIPVLIFTLLGFCFIKVFAYDDQTTHPALTDEIVDFYNFSFPNNQLTSQQKEWIIQGSISEDTPPRWINHFYDPISGEGWTGEKTGKIPASIVRVFSFIGLAPESILSAVEWIHNPLIQEKYSLYGGDRTWKKALEYYADGNQEESYRTLGDTLHLLEDMSVPEHTRNDTHAPLKEATGDEGSPFEEYLSKWNRGNIKELHIVDNFKKENASPISKSSIEDYLIALA